MSSQIFINLPVANLSKSVALYEALGFSVNPQFSDESGKCMVWDESIFVMLLSHDKFNQFISKPIADTKSAVASLLSISVASIDAVNETMEKGLQLGGIEPNPARVYPFMVQRTMEDFDGHTWEFFHMDMSKFPTE